VIHMSHEGRGMKLRDLARGSSNPTSVMTAFHIFRSRFGGQETSRRSRKSYEFVPRSFSAPRPLTLLQQTTVVSVLRVFRCPRHPGSTVTFPVWTDHRDQNLHSCTCHRPASFLHFLTFEQNQRESYHEVLISGDCSQEDLDRADKRFWARGVS